MERPRKRRRQSSSPQGRTLKQYSIVEKLDIIEYAKGSGNRAAGREFNVAESSIREWRKHEAKLRYNLENTMLSASVSSSLTKTPPSNDPVNIPNEGPISLVRVQLPLVQPIPISTPSSPSSSSSTSPSSTSSLTPISTTQSTTAEYVSGCRKRKTRVPRKFIETE